jgi:hypothetical protein
VFCERSVGWVADVEKPSRKSKVNALVGGRGAGQLARDEKSGSPGHTGPAFKPQIPAIYREQV